MRPVLALGASLLLALLSLPAAADDPREASRSAYRRGVEQAEAGNYVAARESFLEAYRLFAHPSILLNLGIARMMTHDYLPAEQDLTRFLSDDGGAPPSDVQSAHAALEEVRKHLGTLVLRVLPASARARLDEKAIALVPGEASHVRTTAGAHALHVEADGHDPQERSVDVAAAAETEVSVELHRVASLAAVPASDGNGRAIAGWVLVGTGALAGGFGVFSALYAKSLADRYNTPGSGSFQDPGTRSTGVTFRTAADVALAVTVVSGSAGLYFLLTRDSGAKAQGATVQVTAGPTFAGLTGRF